MDIEALRSLVEAKTVSREKFEAVRRLVKGMDSRLDRILEQTSRAIKVVDQVQKGKVIDLAAGNWPTQTAEEKKRKKAVLLLIKLWKQLKSEVKRVEQEFKMKKTNRWGRVAIKAKGPIGVITMAAVIMVGAKIWLDQKPTPSIPSQNQMVQKQTIQAIKVGDKLVAVSELTTAVGAECDGEHYHAKDHAAAVATDGDKVVDPGGCGFRKVSEVKVQTVEVN